MPKLDRQVRHEVTEYLEENAAAKEERREVWQWVHRGVDIHDNPWLYAWSGGVPMDLLSALRFDKDLSEWYDSLTSEERKAEFGTHSTHLPDDELIF